MFLKLAWRNLWRNKGRTLITLASIFFAVILSILMMSMKEGSYAGMMDTMVGSFTGYLQVQSKDYVEEKNINNVFVWTTDLQNKVEQNQHINAAVPRIESFALAASYDKTKGAMVIGIDLNQEKSHSKVHERIVEGSYLIEGKPNAIVGSGLAEYLGLTVGDSIVLLGQGYHGVNAAGKYEIAGIVKMGSPDLSKRAVFLPIDVARRFYGMDAGHCTNVILVPKNKSDIEKIARSIHLEDETLAVLTWRDLLPELENMIATDRVEGYVFMFILYMVIAFGVFGTILMMLAERKHEFGVLVSIGLKKWKLSCIVWFEVVIISLVGAVLGMVAAFPICGYFHLNPISFGEDIAKMMEEYGMEAVLRPSIAPEIFLQQGIVVFIIACIISFYPFYSIARLNPIKAMRS